MSPTFTWLLIALCLSQAATLSGLNLAVFSISRIRLEALASGGDRAAQRLLDLRQDANLTLVTILWANVGFNVLLAQLSSSVLAGAAAFLFSTVALTLMGEIVPQAWFSRHALRVVDTLFPLIRLYRVLLWPVSKPVALALDALVGREGIRFIAERELGELILRHAGGAGSDISDVEARGAVNFLALDDVKAGEEGEPLDPASIVTGWVRGGSPALPSFERSADDPFLRELARSGRKWVVLLDEQGEPAFVVNAPWVLRRALFSAAPLDALEVCRRPVVTHDPAAPLDGLLQQLKARGRHASDDVIDVDLILLWSPGARRIITGSDLLGRLLRGIARRRSGR